MAELAEPIVKRELLRPHTWVAFDEQEVPHWEEDYGSITAVPGRITRLMLVAVHNPDDAAWQAAVVVPRDAEPVCFWRTAIEISQDDGREVAPRRYITVIGWKRGDDRVLLWGYADGSVLLTNCDIDDIGGS